MMRILIRPRAAATPVNAPDAVTLRPSVVTVRHRAVRILDFDCECRPLSFMGGDYVTKDITAMAWAWTDQPDDVTVYALGDVDQRTMLQAFREAYDKADMVTGHYIRGFDLPLVNGAMTEHHLSPLPDKLSHDTKLDLVRRHGQSGSQENLGAMLGLDNPKVQMNQHKWRSANRLTPEGIALSKERVVGDVKQHIEMRKRLLELGYLAGPKVWSAGGLPAEAYTP
jgi:hypothetical protein